MARSRGANRTDANRPRYPRGIERTYRAHLDARVKATHRGLMARLRRELSSRVDAARTDDFTVAGLVAVVREYAQSMPGASVVVLERIARQLDLFTTAEVKRQVQAAQRKAGRVGAVPAIPTEARAPYRLWIAENVGLIKSIDDRYFADIIDVIAREVPKGTNTRELTRLFQGRYGVSRSRAKLIARDQVGKLNGQVTEARQREYGVRRYIWRTSRDERVRDSHEALEGRIFAWTEPPPEGHPGEPIQCRCTAEPVVD